MTTTLMMCLSLFDLLSVFALIVGIPLLVLGSLVAAISIGVHRRRDRVNSLNLHAPQGRTHDEPAR
ncbi:MAG TPA: hypothetical protein VF754_10360 [Pyrinomonadaceae bacterium]